MVEGFVLAENNDHMFDRRCSCKRILRRRCGSLLATGEGRCVAIRGDQHRQDEGGRRRAKFALHGFSFGAGKNGTLLLKRQKLPGRQKWPWAGGGFVWLPRDK